MSNLFTRIKDTISADFNEMLDQKEQKNPIAQLNQYVRRCEQEVKKIRGLVEKQYALKQEFTREYHQAAAMADKRKRQAEIALRSNEEDLHEQAQKDQEYFEERAAKLDSIRQNAIKELESLESKYVQMKHKLKDLYVKRMELKGRENAAQAHKGMNKVLHTDRFAEKSSATFDEMEDYIERLENQVNAEYRSYTLDARIAELEKRAE
ncbi:PspA/IM30 family protein [Sediminibacillus halophilus]|uniref:Phage shock protein A n=1 Tax=Sediminibacillus halophilus TaxID=482461 RepID=A0A1G9TPF7_9BACI|nr:PspA/IM30 family protein [Sediminibacillus halophilus]SDM49541.1 Phage shock protein A [Sediminibacillus halophilus]